MNKTAEDRTTLREWVLFCILSVLALAPLWFVQYPPLKDYWNHLLKAKILLDYFNPELGYSKWYYITLLPVPNSASTILIALLMKMVSPMTAGKLFVSIYLVGFPLSSRYLVRSAGSKLKPLQYIGFPLVYNPCLWGGYIDFCLSAVIAQVAIGYWIRTRGIVRPRAVLAYGSLLLFTYIAHFWSVVVLCGVTFILVLGETRARKLIWFGVTACIAGLLMIYARGSGEAVSLGQYSLSYKISMLRNFISLPRLSGINPGVISLSSAAFLIFTRLALFGMLLVLALKNRNRMLAVFFLTAIVYFVLPGQLGRMYEPGQRTLVFLPALLAAAVNFHPSKRYEALLLSLILSISIAAPAATFFVWRSKQPDLRAYHRALALIPAHKNVLNVITLTSPPFTGLSKLLGSDAYTSERFFGAIYNLEKGGFYPGTFTTGLVKMRASAPSIVPVKQLDNEADWPHILAVNIDKIAANAEYVVVAGPGEDVDKALRKAYTRVWRSRDMELFRPNHSIIKDRM